MSGGAARSRVRVLIADDKPVVRFEVRRALAAADQIEIVAEAENGVQVVELLRLHLPDVLLLEPRMPLMAGFAAFPEVTGMTRVVVLTGAQDPAAVLHALDAGVRAYLVHGEFDPAALPIVVTEVAAGRSFLSPHAATALVNRLQKVGETPPADQPARLTRREREIMALIADGFSNRQIAQRLVISEKTVKNHIVNIYRRLGAGGRGQAVTRWLGQ